MHEMSLFKGLLKKIKAISDENNGKKILKMKIRLGALAHLSADHFKEHFDLLSPGTAAAEAILEIVEDDNESAPFAQDIILESVDVEA